MLQQSENPSSFFSFKVPEFHSPIHFETNNFYYHNPSLEGVSSQELPSRSKRKNNKVATSMTREKRKRNRTKPIKNIEEMESQRMTHIAVERNRRRQMNVHLNSLRSIIPPYYIQRGDQASIVGGAIDFVKILEQQLQSLEAQKMMTQQQIQEGQNLSDKVKVDATVIESHVNLKIKCMKEQGKLVRLINLLEKLGFSVLHLNITSPSNTSVSYSFNLKMEENCNLGSADEIKNAIHQIFDSQLLD